MKRTTDQPAFTKRTQVHDRYTYPAVRVSSGRCPISDKVSEKPSTNPQNKTSFEVKNQAK